MEKTANSGLRAGTGLTPITGESDRPKRPADRGARWQAGSNVDPEDWQDMNRQWIVRDVFVPIRKTGFEARELKK